jgi:5'(3')-deoxyribonucleotidase
MKLTKTNQKKSLAHRKSRVSTPTENKSLFHVSAPKEIVMTRTERSPKKVIVDIDNTLWNLAPELWEHLKAHNPKMLPPSEWRDWDCWKGYITIKDLLEILNNIHMQQEKYPPIPEAKQFLEAPRKREFYIIIASHREKKAFPPTERWLRQNGLLFDEIHLSNDKSVLFPESWAIIDDSPITLDKAARAGIIRTGLSNPWNENSGHPLFNNLLEVLGYLDSLDGRSKP